MTDSNYNIQTLKKEIENARNNNYFSRIENFYKRLPKTECSRCGQCCYDPPVCTFIEFMYAYELYDTFNKEAKKKVLVNALKRYINSLVDKFSHSCCFLDSDNGCLIYTRACLSCKRWGTYGKEQYEENWNMDSEYNRGFQKFYSKKYGIVIPDENINVRLPYCDKVEILKNPYKLQEYDFEEYVKSLYNVELKCHKHARINPNDGWSVNEWLLYFTFGKDIFNTRIELVKKIQSGYFEAVDSFIDNLELS